MLYIVDCGCRLTLAGIIKAHGGSYSCDYKGKTFTVVNDNYNMPLCGWKWDHRTLTMTRTYVNHLSIDELANHFYYYGNK